MTAKPNKTTCPVLSAEQLLAAGLHANSPITAMIFAKNLLL